MEQRKSHTDVKGNAQAGQTLVRQNTDAVCDGGLLRSSVETSVMGVERRGQQLDMMLLREQLCKWEDSHTDYQLKSRVMGDYQARFCERLGVKFPLPTRPKKKTTTQ